MRAASPADRVYRTALRIVRFLLHFLTNTTREGLANVPAEGPVIVAGNHISTFDPIVLAATVAAAGRRPRAMATGGLFRAPVLGPLLHRSGFIPVHRRSDNPAAALEPALDALRNGQIVMLYPEGRITTDPDYWPLPARTGVVRLALDTGAPVVPVAQWGAQLVIPNGRSPLYAVRSVVRRRRVRVLMGEPIDLRARLGVQSAADASPRQLRDGAACVMAAIEDLLVPLRGGARTSAIASRGT
jgi:1-acyl-sn-glycerol-3-phosphate acyltransferase